MAKLVERGRLALPCDIDAWLRAALAYPGVLLLPLTPSIAAESTRLPGEFHSDPADQILVATARIHGCPLLTADAKIRAYPHVNLADAC
ncbi:type II toxin-antitoxin system VapC family toxin [Sorangium sp. So ce426]